MTFPYHRKKYTVQIRTLLNLIKTKQDFFFHFFTHVQIENLAGIALGEISKKWRGCGTESLTDMDTFKIEFPDNIDVPTKALLLGATMLVVSKCIRTF